MSALQELLSPAASSAETEATHLLNLARQIQHNLQHQHRWSQLSTHTHAPHSQRPLPRPLISGLPPKRAYIHPDEQIELLKHETRKNSTSSVAEDQLTADHSGMGGSPEREWVLPTHVGENWSLKALAAMFDAVEVVPPPPSSAAEDLKGRKSEMSDDKEVGWQWRGQHRQKRMLIATVHDDSTVVYYIAHDGIVKPRQN
ncbi:hypothetical protein K3495_g3296 [Podosphaera aphanis]|nr:hypothetical protein K3495_g3296 [Podosphaera aphanis]